MPRFAKKVVVDGGESAGSNAYEAERAARIAANKARMAQLGILDTTRALTDAANAERLAARNARASGGIRNGGTRPYQRRTAPALTRRSTRLSGVAPKDYGDGDNKILLNAGDGDARDGLAREGLVDLPRNPEVYTAAHKEALGTCDTPWTLFVDGYDAKGNRIYDPVRGACCHQCRQKTVCKHTSCAGCGQLRGQFCGDCLFMRYGENIDEVAAMGDEWRCPPCRDLCNCSFCRQRKVRCARVRVCERDLTIAACLLAATRHHITTVASVRSRRLFLPSAPPPPPPAVNILIFFYNNPKRRVLETLRRGMASHGYAVPASHQGGLRFRGSLPGPEQHG